MSKQKLALVPWTALPERVKPTWGDNSRKRIIALMREGMSADEISEVTGNRLVFIKTVLSRALNPEDYVYVPPVRKPRGRAIRIHNCYACGINFSKRWHRNSETMELCAECSSWVTQLSKPIKAPHVSRKQMIICSICNNSFEAYPSAIQRGRKYCSLKCSGISSRGTHKKSNRAKRLSR